MRTRTFVISLSAVAILVVLAIVFVPPLLSREGAFTQTYWPTLAWYTSTPEEQGFDSGKLVEALQAVRDQNIHIDSLLIIRNGYVVLDAYFYPYDNTLPHKLASVTKSFMTTLIGIAIDQGKIQFNQPMLSFFPHRTIANIDARKQQITVGHLASMMNGFSSGCLSGDEPTLIRMRASPDWVQATLDRKVVKDPGSGFCYDSPGMHLLSALLQEATGKTAFDYARQNLFEPLGIHEVLWRADPQGYTRGWGDLYLKPLDAAKLGYLWLNGGVWEGKQVISAEWVEHSVQAHSQGGLDGYGYGWWVSEDNYYAMGSGGQYIKIYPAYNIIVVTTASAFDYDQISPLLSAAFVDPDKPLSTNPDSVAELNQLLADLTQAPEEWPVGVIQNITESITGKTYVFETNAISLTALRLDSSTNTEVRLTLKLEGEDATWPIGLDGKYRLASSGQGLRGYWADSQTLHFVIFEYGLTPIELHFEDERVQVSSPMLGLKIEGQVEDQ